MGRWEGLMVDRMEGHWADLMVDRWADRKGDQRVDRMEDRSEGHSEVQKVDRMEDRSGGHSWGGHSGDLMVGRMVDQMEVPRGDHSGGQTVDRTVVWEPPWGGRAGGMMLVVPGWFLSLPTPASTA